jgi:hypothetical protein
VRDGYTANLLPDGAVLVAGGGTIFNSATKAVLLTASAEICDSAAGSFSPTALMTTARYSHAAVPFHAAGNAPKTNTSTQNFRKIPQGS